jgi:hypothetical protein
MWSETAGKQLEMPLWLQESLKVVSRLLGELGKSGKFGFIPMHGSMKKKGWELALPSGDISE